MTHRDPERVHLHGVVILVFGKNNVTLQIDSLDQDNDLLYSKVGQLVQQREVGLSLVVVLAGTVGS